MFTMRSFVNQKNQVIKLIIFVISTTGLFTSLYFSEIMKLPPCSLCWYQRIFLYPTAIISLVNIFRNEFTDHIHEFVLSLIGFVFAVYHNLLYYGVIENIVPCTKDVSCTSRQIEWFGFITIPMLSLLAFISILSIILFGFITKEKTLYANQ